MSSRFHLPNKPTDLYISRYYRSVEWIQTVGRLDIRIDVGSEKLVYAVVVSFAASKIQA
jgi:hypothetical protein